MEKPSSIGEVVASSESVMTPELEKPLDTKTAAPSEVPSAPVSAQASVKPSTKSLSTVPKEEVESKALLAAPSSGNFLKPTGPSVIRKSEAVVDLQKKAASLPPSAKESKQQSEVSNKESLAEIVEQDSKEFSVFEMNEVMPKSRFKDKSFLKLREFFESIISDLENAQRIGMPLEEVKEEFYFVWDALQKSHDNLDNLLHKDIELSVEVADTMAKTRNLIRIAEDQPEKAMILGRRLETAWNLVDISEAEEKRNTARLEELETEIVVLNKNITAAANMEGRTELNELVKIKRKLTEERDSLTKEMGRMRTTCTLLRERKLRQKDKKTEYQEMIKFADEEAIAQSEALRRETARKERIEKSIKETTRSIEAKTAEIHEMEKDMSATNSKIAELERNLRDQRIVNEVSVREAEAAWTKQEKLKADVEAQIALVERLAVDAYKRQTELKAKEDEILVIRMDGVRAERQRLANSKKCEAMQETLEALESEREVLRLKILQLEKDLDKAQRRLEESKKEVEELDKQRTIVNRNLQRAVAVTGEHENQIKISAIAVNNLEGELDGFHREIATQTETIHRLERERDYYSHEATKLANVVTIRKDAIKRLDLMIFESKRKVAELEDALKAHQQNYETALVEKQYYERALRDSVTDISACAKSIRHVKFERTTLQYSEENYKNALAVEEEKRERLVREKEFLVTEAARIRHMAVNTQREGEALEAEMSTLGSAVATGENEIAKQRYYATSAESRKQNYLRKMMKKESELQESWAQWKTLHSMVRIGAYHYRNMMKEIREIRQSIMNLRRVQLHFKGNKNHIVQLKQEISALENCIAKETCMVNALEDEMTRPINIHRWRILEAIDPEAYSMVKKISIVTKRLVDHNEQIRKQNLRITDQEHVYVDIKGVTRHLPGLETPEERQYYEVLYKAKRKQLNTLRHEIYANEAQTSYFRNQVAILDSKMKELQAKYFKKKKAEFCMTRNWDPCCQKPCQNIETIKSAPLAIENDLSAVNNNIIDIIVNDTKKWNEEEEEETTNELIPEIKESYHESGEGSVLDTAIENNESQVENIEEEMQSEEIPETNINENFNNDNNDSAQEADLETFTEEQQSENAPDPFLE